MEYAPDLIADLAQPVDRVFKVAEERRLASSQTPMTIADVETGWRELLREIGAQTLSLCPSSEAGTSVAEWPCACGGTLHYQRQREANGQSPSGLAQRRVERRVCSTRHSR